MTKGWGADMSKEEKEKALEKKVARALKGKAAEVKPDKNALKKIQAKIEKKGKK